MSQLEERTASLELRLGTISAEKSAALRQAEAAERRVAELEQALARGGA